jgi:4-carboxymuconolactone decarboxylase
MPNERQDLASETARRIFGYQFDLEAKEGEPASAAELRQIFSQHAFADSWSRGSLDDRSRSLITVAIAATLGMERELQNHVAGALGVGVTPDELVDLFIHVGVYAGVPRGSSSWRMASEVIRRR